MSIKAMAVMIDERINELQEAYWASDRDMQYAAREIRQRAGQTRRWERGDFRWNGELSDAIEICRASSEPYRQRAIAQFDKIIDNRDQIQTEVRELNTVWFQEQWTRAFLVTNSNGHVHKTVDCSTCFESTNFEWLTNYSADPEDEIVRQAGEMACTVCYPSAPADILNQPCTIQSKVRAEKEAAAKAAAEAKAAREAKKKASAPTASGDPISIPSRWSDRAEIVKTERSAVIAWNDAESDKGWSSDRPEVVERLDLIQQIIEEALAGKHGVTVEEKRLELATKFAKRKR